MTGPQGLGVGNIIGLSFSVLLKNFSVVLALGFLPAFGSIAADGLLLGWDYAFFGELPGDSTSVLAMETLTIVGNFVFQGIGTALLVQLAYDAQMNRPVRAVSYARRVVVMAVPVIGLNFVVTVLILLGLLAFILPGLWVYVVLSLVMPCVVIEGAGFNAMKRSSALTQGFRWPIFGVLLLMWVFSLLIGMVGAVVAAFVVSYVGYSTVGILGALIAFSVAFALAIGVTAIAIALVYARMREIKEGVGLDDLASVFE